MELIPLIVFLLLARALVRWVERDGALALAKANDERESTTNDVAVGGLARALVAALGVEQVGRSHRNESATLVGKLGDRSCELRVDPGGYRVRVELVGRLPDGIHVHERGKPGARQRRVDLGRVRGEVPEGLMPVMIASCAEPVSRSSLSGGGLELVVEAELAEFAGRPEQLIALIKRALNLGSRLERDFRIVR